MKSPEFARKVYELLHNRSREKDVKYMEKWDDLLRKYKIQYIKSYFHEDSTTNNEEDRLFNIINSPKANKFIYVRDPYTSTDEYILKVPLKVATKMVLLGTLP